MGVREKRALVRTRGTMPAAPQTVTPGLRAVSLQHYKRLLTPGTQRPGTERLPLYVSGNNYKDG